MRIQVDVSTGAPQKTRFSVEVPSSSCTIEQLRAAMHSALNTAALPEDQRKLFISHVDVARLIFAGRILENRHTLLELAIGEDFVIQMMIPSVVGEKRPRDLPPEVGPPTYDVKALGFDPIKGFPTPGAGPCPTKQGDKTCGFNAGTSGLCSKCYRELSLEDKIERTKAQMLLQGERNKKILEEEAKAAEEKALKDALEHKRLAELAAATAKAEAANMERKAAGKCFLIRQHGNRDVSWNLYGMDKQAPRFHVWSCGACTDADPVVHGSHPAEEWTKLSDVMEKLNAALAPIIESSDGDYPWEALYFGPDYAKKCGVTPDDDTAIALRKVLQLPEKTKFRSVAPIAPSRKTLWDQEYYFSDGHVSNTRLTACKKATTLIRSVCEPKSIIRASFSDEMMCYPELIAAKVKNSPCILIAYGTRVDT